MTTGWPAAGATAPPHRTTMTAQAARARSAQLLGLLVALPLIYGSFQYIVDVYPLYALSKLLPILLLPLASIALIRHRLPASGWFVALGLYAFILTPLVSAIDFGGGFVDAATAQVKLLPISYYFSFFLLLWYLAPSYRELLLAVSLLGIGTLILFPLLWVVIPEYRYHLGDKFTKLFLYDPERGYRITLPLFFLEVFLFYHNRKFWATYRLIHLAWMVATFLVLSIFDKERLVIVGLFVLCLSAALSRQNLARKLLVFGSGAAAALLAVGFVGYFSSLPESASVSVREGDIAIVLAALDRQPIGWLFGLGSVGHYASMSLKDIYQYNFYLVDIGLPGMIFEYGIIGVSLFVTILACSVRYFQRKLAFTQDPLLYAFRDQVLYQMLVAPIYSLTLLPAEWAATFALFVYFRRRIDQRLGPASTS